MTVSPLKMLTFTFIKRFKFKYKIKREFNSNKTKVPSPWYQKNMPEWEEMHKEGNRPWDLKGVTPMLKYFIESEGEELQEVKRICVPGCGQVQIIVDAFQ